ncbi:MAG TPA: hypothetical protein DEA55_07665 [Rhodospirillaceae bacterium]|nr:hypothetical protein [Rhodospirillaceae bacterium]
MSKFNSFDSNLFNGVSARSYGPMEFNPFAQQQLQEAPKETILQSLAPNKNFKVEARPVESVDATQKNVQSNIDPKQKAADSVGQQCANMKADITATIKEAQGKVQEVTKSLGLNFKEVFPDESMAPDSCAELACQAIAGANPNGAGSLAKIAKVGSSIDTMAFIASDRKQYASREEAEAAIEQKLREISSAPQADSRAMLKASMSADASPEDKKSAGFDWNRFFDEGHKLKDLMSINPENPQPKLVPEYTRVCQIENTVAVATATNIFAEENTNEAPVGIDTRDFDPKMPSKELEEKVKGMDPEEQGKFRGDLELVSQSLGGVSGKLKGMDTKTTSLGRDVKDLLAELEQPKPQFDPPTPRPMAMGMVA